ncbi:conserved hypothetical protein [Desulfatibacillum aliphaticivorans]|uniref:DUF11 domain-containing protein n=1 Tax=Desulfatibacillum aliphaticivorans TaxID=218208 RepID=B8F9Z1_DESAL|nr:hypothetical protein [Desulfatibacillum aliphaticivorans]ACL03087.1 conserved hypothetical protein [Desulfatibacillum aliphaticivorans]
MRQTVCSILVLLLTALSLAMPAMAEEGAIELKSEALMETTVVNDQGVEEKVIGPVDKVVPGSAVIYRITYKHVGQEPATDVFVTNPIPEHMFYLDGTSKGTNAIIKFSVDGGATFDFPGNLKIKNADGTERNATAKDYTHVRWTFNEPLLPGSTGVLEFSAQLE